MAAPAVSFFPFTLHMFFFIVFKDTHSDRLRTIPGQKLRKNTVVDTVCDCTFYGICFLSAYHRINGIVNKFFVKILKTVLAKFFCEFPERKFQAYLWLFCNKTKNDKTK